MQSFQDKAMRPCNTKRQPDRAFLGTDAHISSTRHEGILRQFLAKQLVKRAARLSARLSARGG